MFNALVSVIFKFILWLAKILSNIILAPITLLLCGADGHSGILPNMSTYISNINTFINDYWFNGVAFIREVFFNVTGFPRDLIGLTVTLILAVYGFKISFRAFAFLLNMIKFIRKGD